MKFAMLYYMWVGPTSPDYGTFVSFHKYIEEGVNGIREIFPRNDGWVEIRYENEDQGTEWIPYGQVLLVKQVPK